MTNCMDIWRAAKLLVDQQGTDAPIRAAQRADEMLAAGDIEGGQLAGWALEELREIGAARLVADRSALRAVVRELGFNVGISRADRTYGRQRGSAP